MYLIVQKDIYWSLLLPILFFYIFSLDVIVFLIVFLTPLAINIRDFDLGVGISLPTEPLMFGVLIIFILKIFYEGGYSAKILKHPVTIAILFNLIWILFTSITSEMPIVSFKYLISRLWFVIPFYFVGVIIFKKYSNIKLFSWLYVIPFLLVIGYTIYNHALRGFDEESGHWVMTPFYNDHTAYGAIIALFIPVFLGFFLNSQYKRTYRLFSLVTFIILTIAIILSYSRAAWISLAVALIVYIIILLKIKFRWIFLTIAIIIGSFFTFQNEIRMFKERPVFGWGPGTYQFFYAPYQLSREKTIISTNAGDMGNAHSEYIGPLSEMGILGMLSIIVIVVLVIITALKTYKNAENREVKFLSLITLLGLITYFVHGFLNNFLDTDKASVPVWGFIAMIVALNIYHAKKSKKLSSE
jgi:hypothetical protein